MNQPATSRRRTAAALLLSSLASVAFLGCGGADSGPIELPPGSIPANETAPASPLAPKQGSTKGTFRPPVARGPGKR